MSGAYRDLTLSLNPIHFWEMFESVDPDNDGGPVVDHGSLGDNCVTNDLVATHQPGPSVCSFSMQYDMTGGATPRVATSVDRTANSLPGDFTVIAWANPDAEIDDGSFHAVMSNTVSAAPDYHWWLAFSPTDGLRAQVRTFQGAAVPHMIASSPASSVTPGEWYMLAGVYDDDGGGANKELRFYLNGALEATDTTQDGSRNGTESVGVTMGNIPQQISGYICLASMFDYQLTDQNIADLYDAGFVCAERWAVNMVT